MTFRCEDFKSGQADGNLWNQVTNALNGKSEKELKSVKIAASDIKGADARAVVITTDSESPNESMLGDSWLFKVFSTSTNYGGMYAECVNFLNSSSELTEAQKYYARLTYTNAKEHDAHLILFYRNQK